MVECPDGRCDGSGFTYDVERRRAYACTCRPRRIARRKARKLAGVIPRRYQGVSFDRPPVTLIEPRVVRVVRDYVNALDERLARGQGIWLQGEIGTGKTTLAMLISAEALRAGYSVAIYSLPRLLSLLRDTFHDESEASLDELLERLAAVDLLHIDDVGAEQTTPWVLEQLYTIVNTRYEDQKAIVLTTNITELEEMKAQIGERTVSRLIEMCETVPLHGLDQRLTAGMDFPSPAPARPAASGGFPSDEFAFDDELDRPVYGEPRARRLPDGS